MTTTTDLSRFGHRELKMLEMLLRAMRKHGLPERFDSTGVHPMFNMNSGEVFITNDNYQSAMEIDGKIEMCHHCTYCGHEGFLPDFEHDPQNQDCVDSMRDAGVPMDEHYKYEI